MVCVRCVAQRRYFVVGSGTWLIGVGHVAGSGCGWMSAFTLTEGQKDAALGELLALLPVSL